MKEIDLIEHAIKRAPTSPDHAEDVLQFYCDAVEGLAEPDRRVMEFIAKCFRRILAGEPADESLNTKRTRGQRRRRTLEQIDERDFDLALAVARFRKAGHSREEAISLVAAGLGGMSEATVKRACDTFHAIAKDLA